MFWDVLIQTAKQYAAVEVHKEKFYVILKLYEIWQTINVHLEVSFGTSFLRLGILKERLFVSKT